MNPRTTGLVFLVAAILAAFLYFYEYQGGEGWREADDAGERLFPSVAAEAIESITLETSDETSARLERAPEGWRLVEPLVFPADDIALDGMASALAELESERVIEEAQPPAVYGLGDDAQVVGFRAGASEHELRIGKKTPVGPNSYAATGVSDRVFTVPTFRINTLRRSLDDLRERRPLRFDRSTIERIEASWPGAGVVLEKRDGGWQLVEPFEVRADESTVETLLSDLSFLRASGFLDEPPPDAELGLDEPAFRALLVGAAPEGSEEPPRFQLAVGKPLEGQVRAVRAAQSSLYEIPEERFEDFPRRVVAYRFKELARFVSSDAQRVELVFHDVAAPEAPVTIVARRGEEGWSAEPEAMAAGKVSSLVAELARLRAVDIAAEASGSEERSRVGLEPPRTILRVYGTKEEEGEAPKLAEVELGNTDPERGIFARLPEREMIYLLDYELAERLPVNLEAFRNRFTAKEEAESGDESPDEAAAEIGPPQ